MKYEKGTLHSCIYGAASTFSPAIEASHFQFMSVNLTVYHPNISIHAYTCTGRLKLINNSHSSLCDVCQY